MPFNVEAYLENRLTPPERAAFEAELAQNPALQAELADARELHEHLAFVRIRGQVRNAIRPTPQPEKAPSPGRASKLAWVFWVVLLSAGGVLFLIKSALPLFRPPTGQTNETPLPSGQDTIPDNKAKKDTPAAPQKTAEQPIASASNFKPNATMEAFVNGSVRSGNGLKFRLEKPARDAVFRPNRDGLVDLNFSGTLEGSPEIPTAGMFTLAIWDNMNLEKPMLAAPLDFSKDAAGQLGFDFWQRGRLPLGLYYFTIEAADGGEMLFAGRFFVR